MDDQVVNTWQIHNRINLYLLDAIKREALSSVTATSKIRSVARMFAHMHNVRLMWLKTSAPELLGEIEKIEPSEAARDKKRLRRALEQSGQAMAALIDTGLKTGKIKGFKPHPIGFVGYAISHESYHRGEICIALTESGYKLDDEILYGLWEWGKR
jgi:uncharacterized damage-inducible protein DinB